VQQQWLSARQELLLLQEMGSVFAGWQAFIMERLIFGAWDTLQQVRSGLGWQCQCCCPVSH
jgi:hypothetical protein